nr:A24 family peptidase [uncultured Duganella sp.]
MNQLPLIVLCALLALAVWNDLRTRRIPNALVFGGAVVGVALNGLYPEGAGLFIAPQGGIGVLWSLAGLATGLALLVPMYAMRALGAGDVKLMAMVGAFVGPQATVVSVLLTLLAGGVLALVVAAWTGRLRAMLRNTYHMSVYAFMRRLGGEAIKIEAPAEASGRLPYAVAIAAGTLPYLIWGAWRGEALFS